MAIKGSEPENQSKEGNWWWQITFEECKDREPDEIYELPNGVGVSGGG